MKSLGKHYGIRKPWVSLLISPIVQLDLPSDHVFLPPDLLNFKTELALVEDTLYRFLAMYANMEMISLCVESNDVYELVLNTDAFSLCTPSWLADRCSSVPSTPATDSSWPAWVTSTSTGGG